jgi:hypothetical protein
MTLSPNREDIIWAAGLFEGEGTILLGAPKTYAQVRLGMTDRDVVERFARIMGFGAIATYQGVNGVRGPRKPLILWRAGGYEKTQALVAAFWPWMGTRRRAQAVKALRGMVRKRRW